MAVVLAARGLALLSRHLEALRESQRPHDAFMTGYSEVVDELARERSNLPEGRAALLDRGEEEWAVDTGEK